MVQPITMSMGRTSKVFSKTGNRVISETFKNEKGSTTVVTRVLNAKGDVVLTRMKQIATKILDSGKKIITRRDEKHVQALIAGTKMPQQGKQFVDKAFVERDVKYSVDGKRLFESNFKYKKLHDSEMYSSIEKKLKADDVETDTEYCFTTNIKAPVRFSRMYKGKQAEKLQYQHLDYNGHGKPVQNNHFDLSEFEIYNR